MDLQKRIIGSVIFNPDVIFQLVGRVDQECFTDITCREVWAIFEDLQNRNVPIDLMTVKGEIDRLKKDIDIGFILECHQMISSTANVESHAEMLIEESRKRRLKNIGSELMKLTESGKFSNEIIEHAQNSFLSLSNDRSKTSNLTNLGIEITQQAEAAASNSGDLTGITTGFREVNSLTNGWQNSDLVILAARPGMGKTSMAMSLAINAAKAGKKVGVFSMEMSSRQLATRIVSMYSGISSQKILSGNIRDWELFHESVEFLSELDLKINDDPALTPSELSAIARMWKIRDNIDILFVDYLQLMRAGTRTDNREREVSKISAALKALAKNLDIPIIALSQLSRAVETRAGSKRPLLSDLRDSGSIEQDADIVTFLYRPAYYELDEPGEEKTTEFIFAKHRNGGLGVVDLDFLPENTMFVEPGKLVEIPTNNSVSEDVASQQRNDTGIPF